MKKVIPVILLLVSFLCFLVFGILVHKRYQNKNIYIDENSFSSQALLNNTNLTPIALKINSVNVSLPIVKSTIVNSIWQTSDKGISYLDLSPVPGSVGNSILYGHNYPGILGNLKNAKTGDEIEVFFKEGASKKFAVENIYTTSSSDTTILKQTSDARLTLYTCTGFLDTKRLVIVASIK